MNHIPQHQAEASALLASQSRSISKIAVKATESSSIDHMFPIIDLLLKNVELPTIFYIILSFYIFIQIYSSSFWPGLPYTIDYKTPVGNAFHFIFQIAFMSSLEGDLKSLTITFIILLCLTVFTVIILIIQITIYKVKRRLVRWSLFPTKFVLEFLPLMLLMPTGNFIGMVFSRLIDKADPLSIAYAVLSLIIFIIMLTVQYIQSYCFSMSPYIPKTIIFSSSGSFFMSIFSVIPIFLITPYIFKVFNRWIDPFLIALKMIFNIYVVYNTFYMPFMRRRTNFVFAAVFASSTVLDLSAFIISIGSFITEAIQLSIWFISLVLFYIIMHYVMNRHFNSIRKKLSKEILDSMSQDGQSIDTLIREYYFSLNLHKRAGKFKLFLAIGLENMSPMFLNWSLIKFAADNLEDTNLFLQMTKVVCLFPCENRLLRFMYTKCVEKQGLKFHERFMLFQIHSVMNQRQSSSSLEITTKLQELRNSSLGNLKAVRDFWLDIPDNPNAFYQIYINTVWVNDYYSEATLQWPNSIYLYKDYASYQVECGADFFNGVRSKYKSMLIEQGKNFVIDYSFRSLVHLYPHYLKKNILDIKGNFIVNVKKSGSSSSSANHNSVASSNTESTELDNEIEETISVTLFNHHRLRMALQLSIENKKSKNSMILKFYAGFSVVLLAAFLIFFYIFFASKFERRQTNLESAQLLERTRVGLDMAIIAVMMKWGSSLNLFSEAFKKDVTSISQRSINTLNNPILELLKWNNYGLMSLYDFMNALVTMATKGEKVIEDLKPVFRNMMSFNFCTGRYETQKPINISLRHAYIYCFDKVRELAQEAEDVQHWDLTNNMCTFFSNLDDLSTTYEEIQSSLTKKQVEDKFEVEEDNNIIMIAVTIVYFFATAPLLMTFFLRYLHELKSFLEMLRNLDIDVRKEAAKPFKDCSSLDQESIESNENKGSMNPIVLFTIILTSTIIGLILIIGMIVIGNEQNLQFMKISTWLDDAMNRNCYMSEVLLYSIITMLQVNGNMNLSFTTVNKTVEALSQTISNLDHSNDNLLHGLNGKIACIGVNKRFDAINLYELCKPNATGFYNTYQCAPIDKAISLVVTLVNDLIGKPYNYTIEPGSYFSHIFNIVNNHLIPFGFESVDILIQTGFDTTHKYSRWNLILAICGIVYSVLALFVIWFYVTKLDKAYKGFLQLFRRIPPLACNNSEIMSFLLNRKQGKENTKMSTAQSVITMSPDSIILTSRNETIDVINPAITELFGYTPNQLLGQPIDNLMPKELNLEVFNHFELMKQGQCSLTYEVDGVGKTDDDQEIPIHITIVGFAEEYKTCASSFAVILKNTTELQKQREEAEEAKKQSEKLLYNILPRDIVNRLNQGESEIFFSVPSSSIIFIDIVKWSDYAANITPAQIMSNLSLIFAKFDQACVKYNLITKIKLIGDIYMAAAGLFTLDIQPAQHASQMINFALESLLCVEEANTALDASLQVRVGINTGGPLLAGVLGTDKPVFDIIGDPINVASRLQSTCIPSTIQISQSTFELISDMSYNVETRGEIELKGKGKKLAYIVKPSLMSQGSSSAFFKSGNLPDI